MNKKELKTLIQKCIEGDRLSQKELFELHYGKLMGICIRYGKNDTESKELLQTGFIKIFDNLSTYNSIGSFEGWMKKIIINNCIDYYRKNKKNEYFSIQLKNIDNVRDESTVENEDLSEYTQEQLLEAVRNLPVISRTIFNLYVMEGYSHKDISEKMDVKINTSKTQLRRSKIKLKKLLLDIN